MDNYRKKMNILRLIIVLMFAVTVFVTARFQYSVGGLLLNILILIVMSVMIYYADRNGLRQLYAYTADVHLMMDELDKIEQDGDDRESVESRILDLDSFLLCDEMKKHYGIYCKAYQKEDQLECNIADYLNYDQLTENLSLRFCQILPSILTAMGILGTFLGLAVGLTDFDFSSAETMGASIQSFVSGITVAFYTSIYGIVLSMYMNSFSNYIEERFEETLIALENRFDDFGMNRSEQSVWMRLYEEERQQTESLYQLNHEFPKYLADSLGKNLSKSFNLTNSNIQNLMGQIQERENRALEELVQNFLKQLHQGIESNYETMAQTIDRLEKSFHVLGETVTGLSEWQKEMTDEIRSFVVQVEQSNEQMKMISHENTEQMERISQENTQQMERLNEMLQRFSDSMESISKGLEECYQKETKLYDRMDHIVENQDQITNKLESVVNVYETNGESLHIQSEELARKNQNLNQIGLDLKNYQQECREELVQMTEILAELEKNQELREEETEQMKGMHLELEALEYKINHIVDRMADLSLRSDSQKMARQMMEIRQTMQSEIEQTKQDLLQAIDDTTFTGKIKKVFNKQGDA